MLALADGIVDDTAVPADHISFRVDKISSLCLSPQLPFDHSCVVAVGNEADVLAVGFVRGHKTRIFRHPPHLRLRQPAQRHSRMRQLLLRQLIKNIALIL